jgi:type I restriction enzyme M protein
MRESPLPRIRVGASTQPPVPGASSTADTSPRSATDVFRRLYLHLYGNSNASRADRIISDLSLLLLAKLGAETRGTGHELSRFLDGHGSANEVLLPFLERAYPRLVDPENQRFTLSDVALRTALTDLAELTVTSAPAHVLGDAFQALIGPRLRGDKGQFFTPRTLVRAMVKIVDPRPGESVLDPACGTGGFLMEAHVHQAGQASRAAPAGLLLGVDKDGDLARLAAALLEIATHGRAIVNWHSALDPRAWSAQASETFDVILTNPPFGAKIGITDRSVLAGYDLGHEWSESRDGAGGKPTALLKPSEDPQVLFLELCIRRLKPGGRLGMVLPEGIFGNRQHQHVWSWVRSEGRIVALLDCPRTTFQPGTDTKTNVLFFEKGSGANGKARRARAAVALTCGHDRRGRTHQADGTPLPDDFLRLASAYADPRSPEWIEADATGPYIVPRYFARETPPSARELEITGDAEVLTVGELVDRGLITLRKGDEVGSEAYGTGTIPFVRTSDLSNFEVSCDPTKAVSEEIYEKYQRQQRLQPGDALIVVDGRYRIGATALLTHTNYRCVVQSHLRILGTPRRDRLDEYELLFALNLPSVRLRIRDLVFVQSTLGTLGRRLLELELPILHGDGPWNRRVRRFRRMLRLRDRSLARLAAMTGPEYEL